MTVLLSDGRKNLKAALHHILDTFLPDLDMRSRYIHQAQYCVSRSSPKVGKSLRPHL